MTPPTDRSRVARLLACLALVAAWGAPAWADQVRLRAAARVAMDGPVTLGELAALEGEAALALAEIVVVPDAATRAAGTTRFEVTLDEVRSSIGAAGRSPSRFAMRGGTCVVRIVGRAPSQAAPEPADVPREPEVLTGEGPETVRRHVAGLLMRMFGAAPGEIRVLFRSGDDELLDLAATEGRIHATPRNTGRSPRVLVDVRILAGGRTVRSGTVRADVELHKRALVAARELRRHEAADAGAVEVVPMWVAPGGSPVVEDPQLLQGRWAKGRIEAGSILREGEFEPAIVVRRGELVSVLCLSGGVEVTTRARALADGRLGDVIECRKDRRSEPFTALVDGVGRVVMSMDAGGPGEGAG